MKKFCTNNTASSPDSDNVVTLRHPSRSLSNDINFTGVEDSYKDGSDDDVNEVKTSVEKILADVKAENYEPLPLNTELLQRFEEPLIRLRSFLENNDFTNNTSSMAVNGPCKHPVQALRTFLAR